MFLFSLVCATNLVMTLPTTAAIPVSARDVFIESVDRRIAGKDPARALSLLVDYPATGPSGVFRRNPDFWGAEIDFSCVSVWNSAGGARRAGTAISPWHVVFAGHFPLWKGVRITFLSKDGMPVSCAIAATKRVGGTDLMVASLDAALPPSVAPAKLLPVGYQAYIDQAAGFPVVTFNQRREATVGCLFGMPEWPGRHRGAAFAPRRELDRLAFHRELVSGDSGSPAFLIFGTQPALVYVIQAGKAGSGDSPHLLRKELEFAMRELHDGVGPDYVDFSTCARIL